MFMYYVIYASRRQKKRNEQQINDRFHFLHIFGFLFVFHHFRLRNFEFFLHINWWSVWIFRSMLNCVNSLEPQSMNSGIEHAALMISEEKTQHDSRKQAFSQILILFSSPPQSLIVSLVCHNILSMCLCLIYFVDVSFFWFFGRKSDGYRIFDEKKIR